MARSPVLNPSINSISSLVSLKSKNWIFSSIRFGVTDFGMGTVPISTYECSQYSQTENFQNCSSQKYAYHITEYNLSCRFAIFFRDFCHFCIIQKLGLFFGRIWSAQRGVSGDNNITIFAEFNQLLLVDLWRGFDLL